MKNSPNIFAAIGGQFLGGIWSIVIGVPLTLLGGAVVWWALKDTWPLVLGIVIFGFAVPTTIVAATWLRSKRTSSAPSVNAVSTPSKSGTGAADGIFATVIRQSGEQTPFRFWRLESPPPAGSANMRAYFVALMVAQMGALREGIPFMLWKGNFGTHINAKNDRIRKVGTKYFLTERGVEYFSSGTRVPSPVLIDMYVWAIRTGDSSYLPLDLADKKMVRLE